MRDRAAKVVLLAREEAQLEGGVLRARGLRQLGEFRDLILAERSLQAPDGAERGGIREADAQRDGTTERHAVDAGGRRGGEHRQLGAHARQHGLEEIAAVVLDGRGLPKVHVGQIRADDHEALERLSEESVVELGEALGIRESLEVCGRDRRRTHALDRAKQRVVAWPPHHAFHGPLVRLAASMEREQHRQLLVKLRPRWHDDHGAPAAVERPRLGSDLPARKRRRIGRRHLGKLRGDGRRQLARASVLLLAPRARAGGGRHRQRGQRTEESPATDHARKVTQSSGGVGIFPVAVRTRSARPGSLFIWSRSTLLISSSSAAERPFRPDVA